MGIINQYKTFTDYKGLVQPTPAAVSHNGVLYTAQYVVALMRHNSLTEHERARLIQVFRSCELEPGLLMRHPVEHREVQQGPDDYVGAITASYLLGSHQAHRILEYGRHHGFIYDNINSGIINHYGSAYIGRQQQIVTHLQFATGETPSLFRKVWWCIAVLSSALAKRDNQDAKILAWLLIVVANRKSTLCDLVSRFWIWKFKRDWPGGIGDVLANYFQNPHHPSARYLKNEFGHTTV